MSETAEKLRERLRVLERKSLVIAARDLRVVLDELAAAEAEARRLAVEVEQRLLVYGPPAA